MLRKGITGFRHIKDAPLPEVALATFKSACYGIAPLIGAQIVQVEEASVDNNYHSAVLRVAREEILVVCNCVFPVLAFATPNTAFRCQFSPDMGPPIFGQDGPLVRMTLHTKLLLTNDKQKTLV